MEFLSISLSHPVCVTRSLSFSLQGWLNAAQTRLVLDDEKDEMDYKPLDGHTRTLVWVSESGRAES